jgi:hypothetical protein
MHEPARWRGRPSGLARESGVRAHEHGMHASKNTMYEYHVGAEMRANVHARMRTTMNTNAPHQHASMCIRRRLRMCALACAGAGRDVECATCRNVQRVMCHTQYAVTYVLYAVHRACAMQRVMIKVSHRARRIAGSR